MHENMEMIWRYRCDYCNKAFFDKNKCQLHEKLCKKKPSVTTLFYINLEIPIIDFFTPGKDPVPEFTVDEYINAICIDQEKNVWTATPTNNWSGTSARTQMTITDKVYVDWTDSGKLILSVWHIEEQNQTGEQTFKWFFDSKERLISFYEAFHKHMGTSIKTWKKSVLNIEDKNE